MMQCTKYFLLIWIWINSKCVASSDLQCYPVTVPLCSKTLDTGHIDSKDSRSKVRNSPHRKATGKRNIAEVDLIEWRYNTTIYPTFADEKSDADVISSLSYLHPLVATKCSKYIKLFLCSVHAPVCTGKGVVPPCKELCETVKNDCKSVAEIFNLDWPEVLNCDDYPTHNPTSNCNGYPASANLLDSTDEDHWTIVNRMSSIIWSEALLDNGNVCIPPSGSDVIAPTLERLKECENQVNASTGEAVDFGVACPTELRAPPGHYGYTFMGLPNCSAPCPNMYLSNSELWGVRYLIVALAIICLIVTLFTLLTFALDTNRFRYPERPIVFYAFSYLVVSSIFLVGYALGETVSCNEQITNENNEIVQGFVVVEGAGHRLCSAMFLILYYFTVNGTIWWLILTVTWLLAAGFSWGSEAIEERHLYYHAVAWGIPAVQTLAVYIFNKIEGDNVAGVCFVGLYDPNALHYFVLLPMITYLVIGSVALLAGFINLNRVRKRLHGDEENKEKLGNFMLRIGVFSILYIIPQIALVIVYVVEASKRKYWEATWYVESCMDYTVPCPVSSHPVGVLAHEPQHPGVFIFCFKYVMTLIVALPPLFWVASRKTVKSWWSFFTRRKRPQVILNATQTKLLHDADGPHARDRQARLEEKSNFPDPIFGAMGNSELRGSSASVAAQMVSKKPTSLRQQQWYDLTDSDSSTYYSTSSVDSEMSRLLAAEAAKNQGARVVGRKGQSHPVASERFREDSKSFYRKSSSQAKAKQPTVCRDKLQNIYVKVGNPGDKQAAKPVNAHEPLRASSRSSTSNTAKSGPSSSYSKSKLSYSNKNSHRELDRKTSTPKSLLQTAATTSGHFSSQSNAAGSSRLLVNKERAKKPLGPPPLPPRVDSVVVAKSISQDRVLSI